MAPAFCGCHILPRTGSDDSLNVRHHVYASSSAPLFVSRSADGTRSSIRSMTASMTDYDCLRSIFAPLDEPLSLTDQTQFSTCSRGQQVRTPSRASLLELGAYITKQLSRTFRLPKKDSHPLHHRSDLYAQDGELVPQNTRSWCLDNSPSVRDPSNREYFDSDARTIATPTMLSRLRQDPFTFWRSPSETLAPKNRPILSKSDKHQDDVFSSHARGQTQACLTNPSISTFSDTGNPSETDYDTSVEMPTDLCIELPSLAQLISPKSDEDFRDVNLKNKTYSLNPAETAAFVRKDIPYAASDIRESLTTVAQVVPPVPALWTCTTAASHGSQGVQTQPFESLEVSKQTVPLREPERKSHESVHLYNMRISQHLRSFSASSSISFASRPSFGDRIASTDSMGVVKERTAPDTGARPCEVKECATSTVPRTIEKAAPLSVEVSKENIMTPEIVLPDQSSMSNPEHLTIKTRSDLDGSGDDAVSEPSRRPSSVCTVGENHNEAALLWERALRDHRDRGLEESRLRGNGSASSPRLAKSRTRSTVSFLRSVAKSSAGIDRRSRSMSQMSPLSEFKPIDTRLSFDRLAMPDSVLARAPSALGSLTADGGPGKNIDQAFLRARPEELRHRRASSVSRVSGQFLTVPGLDSPENGIELKIDKDNLSISTLESQKPTGKTMKICPSSLDAWSRYPSHTRKLRNGPAGLDDEVIARDFGLPTITPNDEDSISTVTQTRKRSKLAIQFKRCSLMLTKRFMTDLPNYFRSRPYGHRSSIAVGGSLEYPELELLPPIQSWPVIAPLMQPPPTPVISSRVASEERAREDTAASSDVIGSENFTSTSRQPREHGDSQGDGQDNPEAWSRLYQGLLCPVIKTPDAVGNSGLAQITLPASATQSLPLLPTRPTLAPESRKSVSAEELRMSTVDLFDMLDKKEVEVREQALRAAELSWD